MLAFFCHRPDVRAAAAARWRRTTLALAAALAAAVGAHAQTAASVTVVNTKTANAASGQRPGNVMLDFANAEIDAVARTMATITGRNVVVDPRVKGTITLTSTTPVSPAEALRLFAAQLRTQSFALVESNGLYLVLPEAEAKLQSGAVSAGSRPAAGGQIATRIFRLTHENANTLVPVLRPLISPNNTINVSPGTNAIVITDYADNLQRLGRIIAALDVANATGVEIVRLRHAVASDLAPLVAKLLEPGGTAVATLAAPSQSAPGQPGAAAQAAALSASSGDGYRTTLVPEPRSNAIIIRAANPARLMQAKSLIEQLDRPADTRGDASEGGNIRIVYLKNADAAKLAVTLRAALAALPGQSGSPGANAASGGNTANMASNQAAQSMQNTAFGGGNSSSTGLNSGPTINAAANNQPNTGGPIQADPSTNSLIISTPEPIYRQLRAVIDQLDQRRAQVYVESLIAEVNTNRAADLGIQWQSLLGNGDKTGGVIGTNYGSPNIFQFAGQFIGADKSGWSPPGNFQYPSAGFNLIFGSRALSMLANFLQSTGAGNILSTPTLLTLDNEEARIMVGQNVPMKTGSYTTNTGGNGGAIGNPFQTYEREDVGIALRVRPQISEDGSIKLVIYQEVSSIDETKSTQDGFITNKRAIESSVIVGDGQIIALGGLLQDQMSTSEDKVPLLGDIPVMGNLFKSQNRTHNKTNLMVFLRPVIVRDAAAAESYSLDRYDYMRALQQGAQPSRGGMLDVGGAPVMPAATPVNPQAANRPVAVPPLLGSTMRANPPAARPATRQQRVFRPAAGEHNDLSGAPFKTEP
ncbi:MAG: type II secretion system secretin GspD [Burkholderiaceae bacterium]|jgi:general secretion pathway protein D|nr:type II secretion system secretin GspD [Burkholderiaceae bacterium]